MTTRLYQVDPYVLSFDADVVETRNTEDGPAVVFGETYFYPESGGQPFDLGTIDGAAVLKVIETDDETVLHIVERKPQTDRVHCEIDASRRRDHMQQHSGQHVLSAAFVRELDAHTSSFHLGVAVSTIDLNRELTANEIARAEQTANSVVRGAVPIHSRVVTVTEARGLDLRKPPPDAENVRLVEVDGFDNQACCGTHPKSSAEIGIIAVRGFEKVKGGMRVEFVCGDRALADYHQTVSRARALASVLSSSEADLVDTATKHQAERKSMGKELSKLRSQALLENAEAWMDDAIDQAGVSVLVKQSSELGPGELRAIVQKLAAQPGRVILLGAVADGRAHLVFARSKNVDADMGRLLSDVVAAVDGRGGGSSEIAQGGGPKTDGLDAALESAKRLFAA